MNTEATATDEDYRLLASLMDFGSTSTSDPNWDWIPPSPRPIFFDTDAETHTDWSFSGVVGESSDIVTDDLNRPTSRKNMLAATYKELAAKVWLTRPAYFFQVAPPRSNVRPSVRPASEMLEWINRSFVRTRVRSFVNDLTGPASLQVQFMPESDEKTRRSQQVWQAYRVRIEDLRSDAELDDFTVNEASKRDFWSFILSIPVACEAELVLLDNGNLRAIWDDEDGNHFGLQFLGNRTLQYVIFRRRKGSNTISRVAGRDTFDGVKRQVRSFELETLLHI